jgi:hypothetical protein
MAMRTRDWGRGRIPRALVLGEDLYRSRVEGYVSIMGIEASWLECWSAVVHDGSAAEPHGFASTLPLTGATQRPLVAYG